MSILLKEQYVSRRNCREYVLKVNYSLQSNNHMPRKADTELATVSHDPGLFSVKFSPETTFWYRVGTRWWHSCLFELFHGAEEAFPQDCGHFRCLRYAHGLRNNRPISNSRTPQSDLHQCNTYELVHTHPFVGGCFRRICTAQIVDQHPICISSFADDI